VPRITGLLVMAEDQPQVENGLGLDASRRDELGLARLVVRHRHTRRDRMARSALARQAARILRAAGALFCYTHEIKTFSHAAGTVRFGDDPRTAPLDRDCRFRGVENLFVVDASFMPTGGGINPSLTIAANALRVGTAIVRGTLAGGD
jgi:choline dehydrogenase-like flavoprotein